MSIVGTNEFQLFSRYFWLICLAIAGYSYVVGARRAEASSDPYENSREVSLHRWLGAASMLPWVVMGIGEVIGGVPNILYYFRPQDGNPYVLAWFGSIFFVSVAFAYWVFFRGGAEKSMMVHPFIIAKPKRSAKLNPAWIRFFAALVPAWIVLCGFLIVAMDVRIPN